MKNNKQIRTILVCFSLSMLFIAVQFFLSNRLNNRPNGFIRLFPPHLVQFDHALALPYNSYYLAGLSGDRIYLANTTAASQLFFTNYALSDTHYIRISIPASNEIEWKSTHTEIDSPYIYIFERGSSVFLYDRIPDSLYSPLTVKNADFLTNQRFNQSTALSPESFFLRNYDAHLFQNVIEKKRPDSIRYEKRFILETQTDGIFSTDGILMHSPDHKTVLYVYYYRNRFLCLDSDLNLKLAGRTIDTNSFAKIKVATLNSGKEAFMAKPPLFVNKLTAISGNYIYICSCLKANNEDADSFRAYSVLDVYNRENGRYAFSFYLPSYRGNKVSGFKIYDQKLVAIYANNLLVFGLNF